MSVSGYSWNHYYHSIDYDDLHVMELQGIGNNCRNIEELCLKASHRQNTPIDLSSFPNLRKLTLQRFEFTPPNDMQDWTNLTHVEGIVLGPLQARAVSTLPNLKEIRCEPYLTSNQDIMEFCCLCKERSVSSTLKVFEISDYDDVPLVYTSRISDDGLCLVLDTFLNLTTIIINHSDITLATVNIAQKLGNLSQLKILKFKDTKIFFSATNSDLICEWLEISLPYFPKSLEIVQLLNYEIQFFIRGADDFVESRIMTKFYNILPKLREMNVTFLWA
jgi:hypothetical protein